MKPIYLKMTAFGPYANCVELDFKNDLKDDIFVITGQTGAGKTTIFDAIYYALYGETSGKKREVNELRSDFVGIDGPLTSVEFEFEIKGKRYKIERSPKQLTKSKKGDREIEKEPKATFMEIGKEPITRLSDIKNEVEKVIGLTNEQFRKIVMIPQGDFREFLNSKTDEKIEILRKIFGTEYYNKIQNDLKEKAKNLEYEIKDTKKEIDINIKTIKAKEDSDLYNLIKEDKLDLHIIKELENYIQKEKEILKEHEKEILIIDENINKKQEEILKATQLNEKFQEKENIKNELDNLEKKQQEIDKLNDTLRKGKNALKISEVEKILKSQINSIKEVIQQKELTEKNRNSLKENLINIKKEYDKLDEYNKNLDEKKSSLLLLNSYTKEVSIIPDVEKNLKQIDLEIKDNENKCEEYTKKLFEFKRKIETLPDIINEINKKNDLLKIKRDDKLKKENDRAILRDLYENIYNIDNINEELQKVDIEMSKIKSKNEVLSKEYEIKNDIFINSKAILLAKNLIEGMPCPVCGSIHHPNPIKTKDNIPTKEELEELKISIEKNNEELKRITEEKNTLEKKYVAYESNINSKKENLGDIIISYDKEDIVKIGIGLKNDIENIGKEIEILEKEKNELEETKLSIEKEKNSIEDYEKRVEQVKEKLNTLNSDKLVNQNKLLDIKNKIELKYQDLDYLNEIILSTKKELDFLQSKVKKVSEDYNNLNLDLEKEEVKLSQINKNLEFLEKSKNEYETKFYDFIKVNFNNLDEYYSVKLSENELSKIEKDIASYNQRMNLLSEKLKVIEYELKEFNIIDVYKLTVEKNNLVCKKEKIINNISEQKICISNNEETLENIQKKVDIIDKKYEKFSMVEELSKMANGTDFNKVTLETFVLVSYFDDVLKEANKRLEKITSKQYYLVRKEDLSKRGKKGLELDVYDTHTSKTRSVTTLSGGESFKVSLALALGLSDVVQHNAGGIQLDTMFIDEGFGTLDSKSLEDAIDILIQLQNNGRLIGIISHVNELKERIPSKLEVTKTVNGSFAKFKH